MAKIIATFKVEKETKNTRKYQEQGAIVVEDDGSEHQAYGEAIGALYVQKWAATSVGGSKLADTITVTIEAG